MDKITEVRNLCIKNNYFTWGSNEAYEEMFEEVEKGSIQNVTSLIYVNSNDEADRDIIEVQIIEILGDKALKTCQFCNQEYNVEHDEFTLHNGKVCCRDCFESGYVVDCQCGSYIHLLDNGHDTVEGKITCSSCLEYAKKCIKCGDKYFTKCDCN